jgi:hypothetical protein
MKLASHPPCVSWMPTMCPLCIRLPDWQACKLGRWWVVLPAACDN